MNKIKFAAVVFFFLGGLNSAAADFDQLRGVSAVQAAAGSGSPDFPMPESPMPVIGPEMPAMPLPFMPPSNPQPFFTDTCLAYCPWGFDTAPGAGHCACYDPFSEAPNGGQVCDMICADGSLPTPPCNCPGVLPGSGEFPRPDARAAKPAARGFFSDMISETSTATVVCGGVEYPIYCFPMNCGMDPIIPQEWLETGAAYSAYEAVRARQPLLKEAALEAFARNGNSAAAAAVAEPSSRVFSDGAVLFVAGDGAVASVSDPAAARRVYEAAFPPAVKVKAGLRPGVARGVLSCMASGACWNAGSAD